MCVFAQLCPTFCDPIYWSPQGSSVHRIFQARILECAAMSFSEGSSHLGTELASLASLHCHADSLPLCHLGSPRILECVAYPFSRGTSQPRNWTSISCIAGGFFSIWATREAPSRLGGKPQTSVFIMLSENFEQLCKPRSYLSHPEHTLHALTTLTAIV